MPNRLTNAMTLRATLRVVVALLLALSPLASPVRAVASVNPFGPSQSEEHEERESEREVAGYGFSAPPRRIGPPAQAATPFFGAVPAGLRPTLRPHVWSSLDPFRNGLGTPYRC